MIDYSKDAEILDVFCDRCASSDSYEGEFVEAVAEARRDNWIIRKEGKE